MTHKRITITLAALTRCEYQETIEVPDDISDAALDNLVNQRYSDVDAGDFFDDPDYWEAGQCYHQAAGDGITPTKRLNIQGDQMTVIDL